jgi:leader peptidase (prepilin peptidase)/N-methyltransferase
MRRVPDWLPPVLLSPFIGSFAALLIRRLPAGRPVALARSACESCCHALGPREMIPLLSFLLLRGRCRWCGAGIAKMHAAVELACLAMAMLVALVEADPLDIWFGCGLGWALLTLAWIDGETMLLPDALTLPLLLAGFAVTWLRDPGALAEHAAAAAAGYAAFVGIALLYRRLRGHDGLGGGDAKLLAAAGAWLGLAALPWVVFAAALFGLAMAAGLRLSGRLVGGTVALPFGPALCAAIWLVWLDPGRLLSGGLS